MGKTMGVTLRVTSLAVVVSERARGVLVLETITEEETEREEERLSYLYSYYYRSAATAGLRVDIFCPSEKQSLADRREEVESLVVAWFRARKLV